MYEIVLHRTLFQHSTLFQGGLNRSPFHTLLGFNLCQGSQDWRNLDKAFRDPSRWVLLKPLAVEQPRKRNAWVRKLGGSYKLRIAICSPHSSLFKTTLTDVNWRNPFTGWLVLPCNYFPVFLALLIPCLDKNKTKKNKTKQSKTTTTKKQGLQHKYW